MTNLKDKEIDRVKELKEKIKHTVGWQFDHITNLTQEAYEDLLRIIADEVLSLKIDGTTLKELIKWYLTSTDGEFLEERQVAKLEQHLGITLEELLEKLDEGELAIIKDAPKITLDKNTGIAIDAEVYDISGTHEFKQVIWQGGQE